MKHQKKLNILLADDDKDDRFLFAIALKKARFTGNLSTVNNGQRLMEYLKDKHNILPDLLFLDLNMPLKNGNECLSEIKTNARTKDIPVIIYSTSLREEVADVLYDNGAHYYLQKTDLDTLSKPLNALLSLFLDKKTARPPREKFIVTSSPFNQEGN